MKKVGRHKEIQRYRRWWRNRNGGFIRQCACSVVCGAVVCARRQCGMARMYTAGVQENMKNAGVVVTSKVCIKWQAEGRMVVGWGRWGRKVEGKAVQAGRHGAGRCPGERWQAQVNTGGVREIQKEGR